MAILSLLVFYYRNRFVRLLRTPLHFYRIVDSRCLNAPNAAFLSYSSPSFRKAEKQA